MLLWVGLGNPEPQMARQRHNIGFMAVDEIARRHGFSPWRQRFKGLVAEGMVGGEKILALKPLTYMNLSGEAVQQAQAFYKLPVDAITAFHDELDLAFGKLRIKRGGGAAGHNGLRSMDKMLGSPEYWRLRLGIGHPGSKERVTLLDAFLDAVAVTAPLLAAGRVEDVMTQVALRLQGVQ